MGRVVHFEITADNPERAADFYKRVFGWEIHSSGGPEPYWLVKTGETTAETGIDGAIMHRHGSGQTVINTIDVPSWEKAADAVKAAGGNVGDPHPIPGVGTHAYCQDTEGNVFGIMQADRSGGMR